MSLKVLEGMEALAFFVEIIQKEGQKFNVSINPSIASHLTAATASDLSFDMAHNRCSYLYRCGTINLCFAKDCFSKFLSSYTSIRQLMYKWESSPNFTACSISKGPAIDYIALLLALNEKAMLFPWLVKNIKVVTKYGAWRNTTNIMLEVLREGHLRGLPGSLPFEAIEVIQGDPFKELTEKIKDPISNSDVVMMMKMLNLSPDACDQKTVSKSIQLFIDTLKPGAVLFCIDTKASVTEITKVLSKFPGNYLFESTFVNTLINLDLGEEVKNLLNCFPVISGRGQFFVWQKHSAPTCGIETCMGKLTPPVDMLSEKSSGSDQSGLLAEEAISKQNAAAATVNSHQSKCSDQQWAHNFSYSSSLSSSSYSSENKLPTDNFVESKREYYKSDSIEISLDQCTQTENEDVKETESTGIAQLTDRIALLTAELSNMLETNMSDGCLNDHDNRNSEAACNSLNECNHLHKCPCSKFQPCIQNYNKFNYNHSHHVCQQGCSTSNQCGSNISLNESFGNCCCAPQQPKLPTGDNSHSSPQLVIPLNNLSADVLTQIVSLLNQSNQKI